MPEIHLRQLGFTFSACSSFTKIFKKNTKSKMREIYLSKKLEKACFYHIMTSGTYKDLTKYQLAKVRWISTRFDRLQITNDRLQTFGKKSKDANSNTGLGTISEDPKLANK